MAAARRPTHFRRIGRTNDSRISSFGDTVASATSSDPLTPSTQVKFAFTGGGGLKIWINERFAVRLEIRALVPVYFTGTTFFVGTGGAGLGVSGGIPFAQFDFTGGLTVAF